MAIDSSSQWERLKAIIDMQNMTTYRFAKCIGLKDAENLYRIKRGQNRISWQLADRIVGCYPEIRKCWLLCGEGEMLKNE